MDFWEKLRRLAKDDFYLIYVNKPNTLDKRLPATKKPKIARDNQNSE